MVLVLAMMIGLIIGFVLGMFGIALLKEEKRTGASALKTGIMVVIMVAGGVISFMYDWSYLLSYGLGLIVGLSPYATGAAKKEDQDTEENENGNQ